MEGETDGMTTVEIENDLREALGRMLAERCGPARVAALADGAGDWDPDLWAGLAAMGVLGLTAPPEHGGEGMGFAVAVVAQEELGRRLAPVPTVSSTAVQAALLAVEPDEGRAETVSRWLPRLVSGEVVAAMATGRTADGWVVAEGVRATRSDHGWTLDGTVPVVADAVMAGLLLMAATTEEGPALFLVETGERLEIDRLDALDPTRPLAAVRLRGRTAELLAGPDRFAEVLRAAELAALVMLAADAVGVAAEMTDVAVAYAKTRRQFGRAIGSFQAVSHRCADMLVAVESARALVAAAAESLDGAAGNTERDGDERNSEERDGDERDIAVGLAAAQALEAAVTVTQGCLQVHGGMGFTWEHPVHRYLRRAKAAEALIALPDRLRDRAASMLLAAARAALAAT